MTRRACWLLVAIVACWSVATGGAWAAAPDKPATVGFPQIQLEDQFRTAQTPDTLFGAGDAARPLVVIAGDQRRTDEHIRAWANALTVAVGARVRCVGVANLRGLPFFVSKNAIRSSLKKKLADVLVLCDWNGAGFKQLACNRGQVNVQVYAQTRTLVGSVTGTADSARVKEVVALVERAAMGK